MNKIYVVCQICYSSFPLEDNAIAYYKNRENAYKRLKKEEESSDEYGYFFVVKEFELEDEE